MPVYERKTAKALVYNKETKRFLLVLFRFSKSENGYSFPGGGIKKNEAPENAIKRELFEEIGLSEKQIAEFIPLESEYVNPQKYWFFELKNTTRMFLVITEKTPDIKLNWENKKYAWKSFKELDNALNPFSKNLLDKILSENGNISKKF